MLRQHDSDVADKGDIADHAPDDVLSLEIVLPPRIQLGIICGIIISLGQQLRIVSGM